jgi:hypothetical protein
MWFDQEHRCGPPTDEIPKVNGLVKYWVCPTCGTQFRVAVGEYGGYWTGPDGHYGGPTITSQIVRRSY